MFEIKICDRKSAFQKSLEFEATHVISLVDPEIFLPDYGCNQLKLYFYDTEYRKVKYGPTLRDVQKILEFSKDFKDGHRVLIHCEAGISRSTAAAFLIMVQHLGVESLDYIANKLVEIRPIASPNCLMVEHGESILRHRGILVPVAEKIGNEFLINEYLKNRDYNGN